MIYFTSGKKKKEFNLSKEIIGCKNCLGSWIKTKKVKEFIKRLKEEIDIQPTDRGVQHLKRQIISFIIPNLAGKKLL